MVDRINYYRSAMTQPPLSDALHRLMHAYQQQLRSGIRERGVSLPITHIRVLKGICRQPECTAQTIAQRLSRDKAQITRVLNGLMAEGLIDRIDNPKDRRSQLLVPTRAGKQMLKKIDASESEAVAHLTRNLSADELNVFCRLSEIMTGTAGEASNG